MRVLVAAAIAWAVISPVALAQDDEETLDPEAQIAQARTAFEDGTRAYDAGRFEVALGHFDRAYELTGSPDLLYNIATVADRLRQDRRALETYQTFLTLRPDTEDREHIEARIRVLRESMAREDAAEQRRLEEEAQAQSPEDEPAPPVAPEPPPEPRPAPRRSAGPGPWPWLVTGAGGAVAVLGGALVLMAASDIRAVEEPSGDAPTWADVADSYDRAPRLSTAGFVMVGVGLAAVAGGLAWALSGGPDEAEVEVGVGPGTLRLRGRF